MNESPNMRSPLQDRNKKLINLSRQVLEHVRSTEKTTGNQIAKDIIKGFSEDTFDSEFKNIQRRVYDALNVLHALSIISKNRNEIKYRGLVDKDDLEKLHLKISVKKSEVEEKRRALAENLMQFVAIHKLIQRNEEKPQNLKIDLPCLVVTGNSQSKVEISEDSMLITSQKPFVILSDTHLLARMGLHRFNEAEINEHFPSEIFQLVGKNFEGVKDIQVQNSEGRT
jgi:transcription factor Dp-1